MAQITVRTRVVKWAKKYHAHVVVKRGRETLLYDTTYRGFYSSSSLWKRLEEEDWEMKCLDKGITNLRFKE